MRFDSARYKVVSSIRVGRSRVETYSEHGSWQSRTHDRPSLVYDTLVYDTLYIKIQRNFQRPHRSHTPTETSQLVASLVSHSHEETFQMGLNALNEETFPNSSLSLSRRDAADARTRARAPRSRSSARAYPNHRGDFAFRSNETPVRFQRPNLDFGQFQRNLERARGLRRLSRTRSIVSSRAQTKPVSPHAQTPNVELRKNRYLKVETPLARASSSRSSLTPDHRYAICISFSLHTSAVSSTRFGLCGQFKRTRARVPWLFHNTERSSKARRRLNHSLELDAGRSRFAPPQPAARTGSRERRAVSYNRCTFSRSSSSTGTCSHSIRLSNI